MSKQRYPRLGHGPSAKPPAGQRCYCCAEPATQSLWVEWSYMRGDDEREFVCGKHGSIARQDFRRFIAEAKASARIDA